MGNLCIKLNRFSSLYSFEADDTAKCVCRGDKKSFDNDRTCSCPNGQREVPDNSNICICDPPLEKDTDGTCKCPNNQIFNSATSARVCPPNQVLRAGSCVCAFTPNQDCPGE